MDHKVEIGLHRGTVKLVAHDPEWAGYFSEEKEILFNILGHKILDVRHIGSTSIPGMLAKPIIDILVAVKKLADVDAFTPGLNKLGYEDKATGGLPGRTGKGRFSALMRALRQPERLPAVWPEWFYERSRFPFAVFTTRMCTLIIPNPYRSKPNIHSSHDLADRETARPIRADIRQSKTDFHGV